MQRAQLRRLGLAEPTPHLSCDARIAIHLLPQGEKLGYSFGFSEKLRSLNPTQTCPPPQAWPA